ALLLLPQAVQTLFVIENLITILSSQPFKLAVIAPIKSTPASKTEINGKRTDGCLCHRLKPLAFLSKQGRCAHDTYSYPSQSPPPVNLSALLASLTGSARKKFAFWGAINF
ncbi:hypothetical protein, partial [Zymomonas mobilis]|uniref:hypothetical protein n=1 Tax=Zymomonas mobilis TaxID=542 RepID=UPI0039E8A311